MIEFLLLCLYLLVVYFNQIVTAGLLCCGTIWLPVVSFGAIMKLLADGRW